MKIEDMIMVVENRKGAESNFLLSLPEYMEMALSLWGDYAEDMAGAIGTLYDTKEGKKDWSDLYCSANKSCHAAFCNSESQLRGFLMGNFNEGEWRFDEERCSERCLEVLRQYNMKTDGHSLFPYLHYERVEKSFFVGEELHNLNGCDYRVLAVLRPDNLVLLSMADSQIIVGQGVKFFERYPKGERPDDETVVRGVEWDYGVYLGTDITSLDFDILKQEYGMPDRVEDLSDIRSKVRRSFWMHKHTQDKEGLSPRIRKAAEASLNELFSTADPEVFQLMLDKGMYDGMFQARDRQKQVTEKSR